MKLVANYDGVWWIKLKRRSYLQDNIFYITPASNIWEKIVIFPS